MPTWLRRVATEQPSDGSGINPVLTRIPAAQARVRDAAVLVLFGGSWAADPGSAGGLPADADLLLTQRASTLRQHSGQVAFPGGGSDPDDDGPIATALREAQEETGLDPAGVTPLSVWPGIFIPVSGFSVRSVLAYWHDPSPVRVVDPGEAERVVRMPVHKLIEPANRCQVRHPLGYQGPAFLVDDLVVWGFTAGILAGLLAVSGWELDWDAADVRDLDSTLRAVGMDSPIPRGPVPDSPSLRDGDR
ncbi:CoA pyrophosphatase [Aldersonia sp. NBC_00410]|uniref:NUDIX hydrolase n=1 Tax=Aldersonia sp. NBC_00410 TaxID=2975954 RepID=UPI00224EAEBB|nr:CoA pyrophosphatase [Aldersonia sp. NBC_00410]MCX5043155.1 CoA pyrophosphatase [Aldersonia sp. NBC_00410]